MKRPGLLGGLAALGLLTSATAARADVTPMMFVDASEHVTEPSGFMSLIGSLFPESVPIGAMFLSPAYNPNLMVTAPTKIRVTWIYQGASYKSALGYFTWTTNGSTVTVVDRQLILPEASGPGNPMSVGDTVTLRNPDGSERVFDAGEQVGFFIVTAGWNGTGVTGWAPSSPALPSSSPAANETSGNGGIAQGVFTSVDDLNPENSEGHPELARHTVMLQMNNVPGAISGQDTWVVGFEDTKRTLSSCDSDFNDIMFQVQAYTGAGYETPDNTPINSSAVPTYDVTNDDPDGDGVTGLNDYFPDDPTRAFVVSTPAVGYETLAFEDLYPRHGDADFNDAVLQYSIEEVLNASDELKEVQGTFHLIARGAGLDHHFGLAIHGVPEATTGTLQIERFTPDGIESLTSPMSIASMIQLDADGNYMLRLDDLVESTRAALPPASSADFTYSNTWSHAPDSLPASFRFVVTFDTAISTASLGAPPFDPYLSPVHPDGLYDIHRPGLSGLPGRPSSLPTESGADSFLDPNGYPFVLLVPYDFRYPLESVHIDVGGRGISRPYPQFTSWRTSAGAENATWYASPAACSPACEIDPIGQLSRDRPWTLTVDP